MLTETHHGAAIMKSTTDEVQIVWVWRPGRGSTVNSVGLAAKAREHRK